MLEHVNQWAEERLDSLDSLDRAEKGLGHTAPWILCVPAADRADEIVAKLLTSALLERGIGAAFVKRRRWNSSRWPKADGLSMRSWCRRYRPRRWPRPEPFAAAYAAGRGKCP